MHKCETSAVVANNRNSNNNNNNNNNNNSESDNENENDINYTLKVTGAEEERKSQSLQEQNIQQFST